MKSEIDIIIETAKYYNPSNRAISKRNTCTYLSESGDMCAVGRCLSEEGMKLFKEFEDKNSACDTSVEYFFKLYGKDGFENALKEEYRGHDIEFWQSLQQLHDSKYSWDENGINDYGFDLIGKIFGHDTLAVVYNALHEQPSH